MTAAQDALKRVLIEKGQELMSNGGNAFHAKAFLRADNTDDVGFFENCAQDFSMDAGGRLAVAALYRATLSPEAEILDLMAGSRSALPDDVAFPHVTGLDISALLMKENAFLSKRVVFDLNSGGPLPFDDEQFDAVLLCDGLPYLANPQLIVDEAHRVLTPGGALVVTFTDRFYVRKAFALWQALDVEDRIRLVTILMDRAGLKDLDTGRVTPPEDLNAWQDTVHAVIGRRARND